MTTPLLFGCGPDLKKIHAARDAYAAKHPEALRTIAAAGRTIRYVGLSGSEAPTHRPIVFVHGSPGDWGGWVEFLTNENLGRNHDVRSLDRPGYGGSGAGTFEPSLAKQAEAVLAALEGNGSGLPAILVGHSYGGPVVLRAAMDAPEKIGAVVVVAGSVDPGLEETHWYQNVALWPVVNWAVPSMLDVCNREILALKGELQAMESRWGDVRADVYLLHGEVDPLVPVANVDYARKKLVHARSVEEKRVPGMNHFVPWEHPELVYEAIERVEKRLTAER